MMTTLYESLRERAEKHSKDQFLAVPIVPPLGMMIAAAETTDVFREGDQLWDYFEKYDDERDRDDLFLNEGLVARFGVQKAFVIACLADIWGACLQGVDIWLQDRGRSNLGDRKGEDLIYYPPDRCPSGGWPLKKEDATDEHKAYGRCATEPFRSVYTSWWGDYNRDRVMIAPRRLPYRVCTIAARAHLSVAALLEVQDAVAIGKTPFIPCWTKDNYYDEEESYELVIAAMWRGAITWLLSEDQSEPDDFPFQPMQQAVILSHMAYDARAFYSRIDNFFMKLPCNRFSVMTDKGVLSFAADDGYSSYWYQEVGDSKRMIRNEGLVLRVGKDTSGLTEMLRRVCGQKIERIEAIPTTVPWGEREEV
jgi:hypothetical protein